MTSMRRNLTQLVLAASLVGASVLPAQAALIIGGGTLGTIPSGLPNEVLGVGVTAEGYYGASISTTGSSALQFEFIGFEAGFDNDFYVNGVQIFSTEDYAPANIGGTIAAPLGDTFVTGPFGAGVISFAFYVNNLLGVTNAANPDDSGGMAGINFFSSIGPDLTVNGASLTSGSSVYVFLDDAGAGPDDNHDDMVIKITEVPEPASLALLGLGLIGLGGMRASRRNRA